MTASGESSALHFVSAWASEHRLKLGQVKVDDKSNEITAIPALLELLDISGCIITIDAMGTQHEIASRIQALGADYVLALKANHPTLFTQVEQWFETAQAQNFEGIEYSGRCAGRIRTPPSGKATGYSSFSRPDGQFIQTGSVVTDYKPLSRLFAPVICGIKPKRK